MIRILLMLIFFICCSTGGEIAMTYGMKRVGEPESFHPMALLRFIGKAVRNGWVWLAAPLMESKAWAISVFTKNGVRCSDGNAVTGSRD